MSFHSSADRRPWLVNRMETRDAPGVPVAGIRNEPPPASSFMSEMRDANRPNVQEGDRLPVQRRPVTGPDR